MVLSSAKGGGYSFSSKYFSFAKLNSKRYSKLDFKEFMCFLWYAVSLFMVSYTCIIHLLPLSKGDMVICSSGAGKYCQGVA